MAQSEYLAKDYASKCDWEGGFLSAFFGYGMPDNIIDAPDEINQALVKIRKLGPLINKVSAYLDDNLFPDDDNEDDD